MKKNKSYYEYILLSSIREYFEVNKINIHKFNMYVLYNILVVFIFQAALIIEVKYPYLLNCLLILLLLISYVSVEFDNFINFCQDKNNKILLSYPMDVEKILFINNFKYLLHHMVVVNLVNTPVLIMGIINNENIFMLIKYIIIVNLLCILFNILGWIKCILKWNDVKLNKRNVIKDILIVCIVVAIIVTYRMVLYNNLHVGNLLKIIIEINELILPIYGSSVLYLALIFIVALIYILLKCVLVQFEKIYKFYVLDLSAKDNLKLEKEKIDIETLIGKLKIGVRVKKELYAIIRNKNVYKQIKKKLRFGLCCSILLVIYQFIYPVSFEYEMIVIFIITSMVGYGDKMIRNFLPITSEGKMVINYIQSGIDIRKILFDKVNMLFIYRQAFIISPLIFIMFQSKFNVLKIAYFIIIWLVVSYTSAIIKIVSVSVSSRYLVTDDKLKQMNMFSLLKYIAIEISYFYILWIISAVCKYLIKSSIATLIAVVWVSIVYIVVLLLLQGGERKYYGEFKEYI